MERQLRNTRYPVLCGANEQGNLASQICSQLGCPVEQWRRVRSASFHWHDVVASYA